MASNENKGLIYYNGAGVSADFLQTIMSDDSPVASLMPQARKKSTAEKSKQAALVTFSILAFVFGLLCMVDSFAYMFLGLARKVFDHSGYVIALVQNAALSALSAGFSVATLLLLKKQRRGINTFAAYGFMGAFFATLIFLTFMVGYIRTL